MHASNVTGETLVRLPIPHPRRLISAPELRYARDPPVRAGGSLSQLDECRPITTLKARNTPQTP